MAQPLPIAGWYPDPEIDGQDRWWNGATWTDTRRAAGAATTSVATPGATAAAPPAMVVTARRGPGLYIPGETVLQPAPPPAYAPAPVVRNNLALIGFILSMSGFLFPVVVNSLAGGIVSAIGLRHSKTLAGTGILSNGRGLSIAGMLTGFIWGGILLLIVAVSIAFYLWIAGVSSNLQVPGSPVI